VMNNLQGGKSYSILVEILDEKNHVITSEQRTVEVPRDYVFPRNFMLTGNMEIKNDRVFMKGSVITTENFHLTIETKNLIVLEKSVIQSFPFSHKAGPGRIGRNSGTIRISAELAKGELDLIMNSEGGGDGKQGFAGNNLITTRPGECGYAAGRNPEVYIEILDIIDFIMKKFLLKAELSVQTAQLKHRQTIQELSFIMLTATEHLYEELLHNLEKSVSIFQEWFLATVINYLKLGAKIYQPLLPDLLIFRLEKLNFHDLAIFYSSHRHGLFVLSLNDHLMFLNLLR
jgi:hypothetical protein